MVCNWYQNQARSMEWQWLRYLQCKKFKKIQSSTRALQAQRQRININRTTLIWLGKFCLHWHLAKKLERYNLRTLVHLVSLIICSKMISMRVGKMKVLVCCLPRISLIRKTSLHWIMSRCNPHPTLEQKMANMLWKLYDPMTRSTSR